MVSLDEKKNTIAHRKSHNNTFRISAKCMDYYSNRNFATICAVKFVSISPNYGMEQLSVELRNFI